MHAGRARILMTRHVSALIAATGAAVAYSSFLLSYLVGTHGRIDFVSELKRAGAPTPGGTASPTWAQAR